MGKMSIDRKLQYIWYSAIYFTRFLYAEFSYFGVSSMRFRSCQINRCSCPNVEQCKSCVSLCILFSCNLSKTKRFCHFWVRMQLVWPIPFVKVQRLFVLPLYAFPLSQALPALELLARALIEPPLCDRFAVQSGNWRHRCILRNSTSLIQFSDSIGMNSSLFGAYFPVHIFLWSNPSKIVSSYCSR